MKMGIATIISADRILPARKHPRGNEAISKWINEEKRCIAKAIELGFEMRNCRPAVGSEIVYEVTDTEDGGIKVAGWQYIDEASITDETIFDTDLEPPHAKGGRP